MLNKDRNVKVDW